MISFKLYFLVESMLEEIQFQDDLQEDILMLHEIEYKLSKLKDNHYSVNSKLFQNLFRRFYDTAYEILDSVEPQLKYGFEHWKALHQIDDPQTWANMVFDLYSTTEQQVEDIMSRGIHWGQLELTPEEISNYIDPEEAKSFAEEVIYGDPEAYEYHINEWLQQEKGYEGDESEAVEFYRENGLEDEFIEYYIENLFDPQDYADILSANPTTIKNAIAEELYPQYMNAYGPQLESIIDDVDEAVKRLKSAKRLKQSLGDKIVDIPDETLGTVAEEIYKAVSKMATSVSLALNVNHVNGNILEDYAEITTSFMDDLDSRDTTDWDNEVNGIINRF